MTTLNLDNIDLGGFGPTDEQPKAKDIVDKQQRLQLNASMDEAFKVNPDEQARINRLSQASGVPTEAVEVNPDEIESDLKFKAIDLEGMTKLNPKTSSYLRKYDNASVAHDDTEALQGIENTLKLPSRQEIESNSDDPNGFLSNSARGVGERVTELLGSLYGFAAQAGDAIEERFPMGGFVFEDMKGDMQFPRYVGGAELKRLKEGGLEDYVARTGKILKETDFGYVPQATWETTKAAYSEEGLSLNAVGETLAFGFEQGTHSLADMAATIYALPTYIMARSQDIGEIRAKHKGKKEATIEETIEAAPFAIASAILERILPAKVFGGMGKNEITQVGKEILNQSANRLKDVMKAAGSGLIIEASTEAVQEGIIEYIGERYGTDAPLVLMDALDRAAGGAVGGGVAGGGLAGLAESASIAVNSVEERKVRAAENKAADLQAGADKEQRSIDNINDLSANSKLRQRDTESFKQFVEEADGESNTTLYVDGVQTSLYLADKDVASDPALQLLASKSREAAVLGGDLAIPVSEFAAVLAGTQVFTDLRDFMTLSSETASPFRQEQVQAETQGYLEKLVAEAQETSSQYVEAQDIFETVRSQLIDTGQVNPTNASVMAQIVPAWATVYAQRNGVSIQEAYENSGLSIVGPQTGELDRVTQGSPVADTTSFTEPVTIDPAQTGEQLKQGEVDTTDVSEQVETEAFKNWSDNGEVVDPGDINDHKFKADTPTVVKVFHGTTHEFSVFDALRGNLEGQFGAVNYFTSSESDAVDNYAGEGPDLTNRIEQRSERIEQELEDASPDEIQELAEQNGLEFDPEQETYPTELPKVIATQELSGGQDNTMELFVKVNNPFVIGENAEWIELIDNSGALEEALDQVADANDMTVDELREKFDEFEDEIDEARYELEAEVPNKLTEAIQTVAARHDVDASELAGQVYELDQDASPEAIERLIRDNEEIGYAQDEETGDSIQSQIIAEVIEEMGFDSIILKNAEQRFSTMNIEQDTSHVHIFDSNKTNIKSVDNQGTFDPTDPDIFKQKKGTTRGFYDPANSVIRLTEAADLSTFLHEFAHFMYEMELTADKNSPEAINTIESIHNWYKRNAEDVAKEAMVNEKGTEISSTDVNEFLDNGTTGDATKDKGIRRAVHEQFARGFEKYVMEGKAPSSELRSAFQTFARWLTQVYRAVRGNLKVNLDKEMKEVFDRMLATEEQINAAEARARYQPMFTDAAMAGMTEEEFQKYQEQVTKVKNVQSETLRDKMMKELTRQTKKWWKDEKADIVDEQTEILKNEPVYRARDALREAPSSTKLIDDKIARIDKQVLKLEKQSSALEKSSDTIGQFLSKEGGLNRESMEAEGVDPEHFKDKIKVFGRPLFPKKGGMTADGVAELLNEMNFESEELSANEAMEVIFEMLSDDSVVMDPAVVSQIDQIDNAISNLESEGRDLQSQKNDVNLKLDHATVKELIGEQKTDKLGRESRRIPTSLRGMTITGARGVHPDEAAAFFGYGSGSELLADLVDAVPIKARAEALAEQEMMDRHGDILHDGTIEAQADEAVQNEERGKLLLSELKAIRQGTSAPILDRRLVKAMAEDNMSKLSFRQIHPGKYRKAEINAAQESATALANGDKDLAARAKARQILNYYLGMAATKARTDTVQIVDRMNRYNKKSVREAIQKAGNGYWEQITKVLRRFEFKKSASIKSVNEFNENINTWARDRNENDGDGLVLSAAVLNESYVTHWKNVPFGDLQGVSDSVKNMEHVARYSSKITALDEAMEFNKVVQLWNNHMQESVSTKFKSQRTDVVEGRKWGRWAMAQMTKIPFMASWLDGGERAGLSHQILVQPFTDAYNDEINTWNDVGKVVMDAIQNRSKADIKRNSRKYFIPEIKDDVNDGNLFGSQIIAVALNTGNHGNLKKMLLGEGWANPDDDTSVSMSNPKLQSVLKHMTKSDWELVQLIWDQMEVLYPQLSEVHRRTTGLTPPKVEAVPVVTQYGEFKGGYYPVKYDPNRSQKAQENEDRLNAETESKFSNSASIQASINASSTSERTKYYAPIRLGLDVVPAHFQETIHYITHHDAVRQANKLIHNPQIAKTITEKLGPEEYAQLNPWLNDIAKDGRESPTKMFWDDIIGKLRFGITLGTMGFKASTGIIQISGLSNSIAELGIAPVYQSMRSILGSTTDMQNAWDFATANSKVLSHRALTMDREIKNAMKRLEGKRGILAAAQEMSMKHIALIQTYMVDLPTWHAAYIKEMSESGDEAKAYARADWTIENIQGSGATKDLAKIMRGQSETGRMLTMFMTFFSSFWNMERDLVKGTRSGRYSITSVGAKMMFLFTLPVLFEMMMRGELGDEDDSLEDQLQKMLTKVALYPLASVPFARDAASAVVGEFGYNISPVASLIEQGTQAIPALLKAPLTDKEITKGQAKGSSKFIGAALGVPGTGQAWATGEHLYDVLERGEELTLHQLLFGPKRD